MKLSDAIKIRIEYYLKNQKLKRYDLCQKAGIPPSTFSSFMNTKNALPKMDTILHICEGLGITLGEFFSDSIFDEAEHD